MLHHRESSDFPQDLHLATTLCLQGTTNVPICGKNMILLAGTGFEPVTLRL